MVALNIYLSIEPSYATVLATLKRKLIYKKIVSVSKN